MIRLALVEDDALYRSQLREYIDKYSAASGEKFTVTEFSDGDEIALGYKAVYDIILMDIEMKFMDGHDGRRGDPQKRHRGHHHLHHKLAPVCHQGLCGGCAGLCAEAGFLLCVQPAAEPRHRARSAPGTALSADHTHGTAHKIDTAALYWVESCGHDLVFHTAEGALTASGSMAETETRLAQDSFFRVNKGCLVNLEHVDCMDGEDAVVHGERVPIARARRKAFLDALNDYINGAG